MIISLSGDPGSGKSTIAQMLSEHFGWPRYYVGDMRRQKAKERGMTLEEYNNLGETDPTTDTEVDEWQKNLGKKEDNFIIEGRTSWHFIPHSYKIFIKVDPKIGAERILGQINKGKRRKEARECETIEEVMTINKKRVASDDKRYGKFYNIDAFNLDNFDLIIDSSGQTKEETFKAILDKIQPKLSAERKN